MSTTSPATRTSRPVWQLRLAAILVAVVVNVLVGVLAALLGVDMIIQPPGQPAAPITVAALVMFTAVFGLIGWGTLALAERILKARARLVWTIVAVAFTLISFVPSLSVNAGAATEIVLVISHVVVAAVLIPVFWRTARTA